MFFVSSSLTCLQSGCLNNHVSCTLWYYHSLSLYVDHYLNEFCHVYSMCKPHLISYLVSIIFCHLSGQSWLWSLVYIVVHLLQHLLMREFFFECNCIYLISFLYLATISGSELVTWHGNKYSSRRIIYRRGCYFHTVSKRKLDKDKAGYL